MKEKREFSSARDFWILKNTSIQLEGDGFQAYRVTSTLIPSTAVCEFQSAPEGKCKRRVAGIQANAGLNQPSRLFQLCVREKELSQSSGVSFNNLLFFSNNFT